MMFFCILYVFFVSFFAAVYGGKLSIISELKGCPAESNETWSYRGENGPPFWGLEYPNCYGSQQSPIEIFSDKAEKDENLAKLTLNSYEMPISKGVIENNGHTIKVIPRDGTSRTISINGDEYMLQQFHFHWGDVYYKGSEHILDGTQYALEMHLVHMSASNQIAVVGILYQEQDDDNEELQNLVGQFDEVRHKGDKAELKSNVSLNNLLPENPTSYFRYQGSLTTPACTEGVTWSVVPDLKGVGRNQMTEFRKLYSVAKEDAEKTGNSNCKLVNNYRPKQPLYDRKVYLSQ